MNRCVIQNVDGQCFAPVSPQGGCEEGLYDNLRGCFCNYQVTPVLVDVLGNGFDLTNASEGVDFDMAGDGQTERILWTT